MIKKILKKIGLKGKEIKVYSALLQLGSAGASEIAKSSSLPRQTVYSILLDMSRKGYVELSENKGVKHFIADPETLLLVLEKEESDLERKRVVVAENMMYLKSLRKNSIKPDIRVFDGEDGLKIMFENILDFYRKGGEKKFRAMGINKLRETSINTYIRSFLRKRSEYGVDTKLIVAKSGDDFDIKSPSQKLRRDIRRIDIDKQDAGMYIAGDKVFFFSYDDKVGVKIENSSIAKLLRDYFDHTWEKTS